ncbi:MAG: hypothetical protein HUJ75_06370, partial [Parasporobacterium sp.]|nr:hypothetical protein [Parasporobacterium sp.]
LYGEDTNTDVTDASAEDAEILAEESANAVALAGSRAEAKAAKKKAKNMSIPISDAALTTTFPLIGIGAPTHVFLPRVAKLLGTRAITPEYAPVANALGAAVCKRISRWDLLVKVIYKNGIINGYSVMDGTELKKFSKLADAIEEGKKITYKNIKNRAIIQGLGEDAIIEITTEEDCLDNGALMNVVIHGVAR